MTHQRTVWPRSFAGSRWVLAVAALVVLAGCQTSNVTTPLHVGTPGAAAAASSPDAARAVQVRLELASEYLRVGRLDVAMQEVNHVLSINPNALEAYTIRGLIHAEQRNFQAADADYARVLRARGSDPDVLHNYGWILCQQARYDEGIGYLQRALAVPGFATSARTLMAKGLCQQSAGRTAEAKATLERAYFVDPNNPIVAYNLALLLYGAGQVVEAQRYLRPLNASDLANAETLWLGIKVESAMGNQLKLRELGGVLARRFPHSRELALYERGAFYE